MYKNQARTTSVVRKFILFCVRVGKEEEGVLPDRRLRLGKGNSYIKLWGCVMFKNIYNNALLIHYNLFLKLWACVI